MASMEKTRMRGVPEQEQRQDGGEAPGPAPDVLRALVATLVQDTIRAEFDRFVGAAPYERTATRRGHRNGRYRRQFRTRIGGIVLDIPRDRAGLFRPSLFAKYERSEQAGVLCPRAR